jgi:GMP synthase-like glutamine amidotransferase
MSRPSASGPPRSPEAGPEDRPGGLILSHGEDGPAALLGEWLSERGVPFEVADVSGGNVPALGEHAFLASLGAVESATAAEPAWIGAEIALIRRAVAEEVAVLGLCFGGQALSLALGGEVAAAAAPQVGWFELFDVRQGEGIEPGPWFHWHYDQLSVPPGGRELARSAAGTAAFRHGRHLGVQFHPEVSVEVIASWARAQEQLERLGRSAEELVAESERHAPAARRNAWRFFESWWAGLGL